jgi:hypothetical protein
MATATRQVFYIVSTGSGMVRVVSQLPVGVPLAGLKQMTVRGVVPVRAPQGDLTATEFAKWQQQLTGTHGCTVDIGEPETIN